MYAKHGALIKHTLIIEGINSKLDSILDAILSVKLLHIFDWTEKMQKMQNYIMNFWKAYIKLVVQKFEIIRNILFI
jgi:hypothetical protein